MASSDSGSPIADHPTSKQAPDTMSRSRYRFRDDLAIAHSNDAESANGAVTIIDHRSGKQHVLTADEFRVCQAADGTNTLAAIRQVFNTETGRDFPSGKLFAFFRRLRGLGLLEENSASKTASATASADNEHPSNTETTPVEPTGAGTPDPDGDMRRQRRQQRTGSRQPDLPIGATSGESEQRNDVIDQERLRTRRSGKPGAHEARRGMPRWLRGAAPGETEPRRSAAGLDSKIESDALSPVSEGDFERFGGGALQNFRARAARREAEDEAPNNAPARLSFFDPNFSFGVLATLTQSFKYLVLLLPFLGVAIVWLAYTQRESLAQDIRAFDVSVIATIILGLAITNLTSRIVLGTVIRHFGGEVREFGIALRFGIPRFFVASRGISALGRRGQLWAQSAPLIWRFVLFCIGTLSWFLLREAAPSLSHLALVVGQIGLITFLLSAWPLLPSDGYRWLATYFARPTLRADAMRAITARPSTVVDTNEAATAGLSPVTFYLLAVAVVGAAAGLVAQADFDVATTGQVGLLTAGLLLSVTIAIAVWAVALWNYSRGREIEPLDTTSVLDLGTNWARQTDVGDDQRPSIAIIGKIFWAVVAATLLAVAFLPYRYQAAGTFEILPTQRTVVTVRTAGEIDQVAVHEGDWVVANQVLAKLSTKDQQRDVSIASSELQHAKAQLAQFGGDKKPGGDKGAASDLERSIADAIGDEPDTATDKDAVTAANYAKTQAERTARTEVERLTRKLAFARDQLADTTVRAPTAGRVMTPNVSLLTGTYLHRGAELLTLEDTHTLQAEINLPEADVGLVKVGDNVRLRPWADEDREIVGKVTGIAPAAQTKSYGTIVRVGASIPNTEDSLRPAMTGYSKIDGQDMRVWEAFLRRIIRIVRVEMWSWIP